VSNGVVLVVATRVVDPARLLIAIEYKLNFTWKVLYLSTKIPLYILRQSIDT